MKRKPLAADLYLSHKDHWNDKIFQSYDDMVRDQLLMAKRFVLDAQAVEYVATMLRDHPRMVADAHEFAIPPFEKCYVEIQDCRRWFDILNAPRIADDDSDDMLAYLFVGPNVSVIVGNEARKSHHVAQVVLSPIQYRLHQPFHVPEFGPEAESASPAMRMAAEIMTAQQVGISRMGLDFFYWGSSYMRLKEDDYEAIRVLRANHSFKVICDERRVKDVQELTDSHRGDIRNIIGLLLFLNRTSKTQVIEEIPSERRMIGNKAHTLLKHSVIKVHVNPLPRLITLCAGAGVLGKMRRLHDVRGHYCRNEVARESQCEKARVDAGDPHQWEEIEGPHHLQWRCKACKGLKWWRNQHRRGHEDKGIVTSKYEVSQ